MMRRILAFLLLLTLRAKATLFYEGTKLCSGHKKSFCLSLDQDTNSLVLSKKNQLFFDVKHIDSTSLYKFTTQIDDTTYCLTPSILDDIELTTVGLKECSTIAQDELLLSFADVNNNDDKFVLVASQFKDTTAMCLTNTYHYQKNHEKFYSFPSKRVQLHTGSYIALSECEKFDYAQLFQAVNYDKKDEENEVSEVKFKVGKLGKTEIVQVDPHFGFLCMTDKPDLCLGVSLTNGEDLDPWKLVQVKNITKNSVKGLDRLKIEWYKNDNMLNTGNGKFKSAANVDYCLEGKFDMYLGDNKRGVPFYDDALHLGLCDQVGHYNESTPTRENELFEIEEFDDHLVIKTVDPDDLNKDLCASVVKCIKHEGDYCSTFNSIEITDANDIEQGAFVRLKTCESDRLTSQRFFFIQNPDETEPPTRAPTPGETPEPTIETTTPQPTTKSPTLKPTLQPTTKSPTTSSPTVGISKPDEYEFPGTGGKTENTDTTDSNVGKKVGFSIFGIGIIGLIVLVVIIAIKKRRDRGNNEEDETFIARV